MLTLRSRVPPTGAWLVVQVRYWRLLDARYRVRLYVGGEMRSEGLGTIPAQFVEPFGPLFRGRITWPFGSRRGGRSLYARLPFFAPLAEAEQGASEALDALGEDFRDAPVPVFLSAGFGASNDKWARTLLSILEDIGQERPIEIIRPSVGRAPGRALPKRLSLPLDVQIPSWLAGPLLDQASFLRDPYIRDHGLRLLANDQPLPAFAEGADVQIADASRVTRTEARRWLNDPSSAARLRILVNAHLEPFVEPRLPRGTAGMVFPTGGDEDAIACLRTLLYGFSHDLPLHYAFHQARRATQGGRFESIDDRYFGARLYGDSNVDQWFRLSGALAQATSAVNEGYAVGIGADMESFARKLRVELGESGELDASLARIAQVQEAAQPLREALERGVSFDRERDGLHPMSRIMAAKAALDARQADLRRSVLALRDLPGAVAALEKTQERKVDASLTRINGREAPRVLGRDEVLPSGAHVRLSVAIGQRSSDSLVIGDSPALDPLLPSLEADQEHELEIVLIRKDFELLGKQDATRRVTLSRFGGSAPVSWDLRVPEIAPVDRPDHPQDRTWSPGDIAELRFSVYYRNQLLQSFNLAGEIGVADSWWGVPGKIEIRCDFSQTRRFGALDSLGERLINLSLNEDLTGKHTLTVKGSGIDAAAVTWDSAFLSNYVDVLREALFHGLIKDGAPLFSFDATSMSMHEPKPGMFDSSVREMAEAGAALYEQLYQMNSEPLRTVLSRARSSRGETIQVVLLHANYTLPWGLIYDFDLPDLPRGKLAKVCRGQDAFGLGCTCRPRGSSGLCLRGFWGFRHLVEQLAGAKGQSDDAWRIASHPTEPTMGFFRTLDDSFTQALSALFKNIGKRVLEYEDPRSFVDLLEDPATRPSLVMYVGHQDVEGPKGAPAPKLLTVDNQSLLRLSDVRNKLEAKSTWEQPRSLVLLLGCSTGAARVDTGIGLAGALLNLGAVGVLGTECTVYSDLVVRVARDLRQALFDGEEIGKALHDVIWQLAREGFPMGLVFTYVGPIKAQLP